MPPRSQTTTPSSFIWLWTAAALIAATALAGQYGFHEPLVQPLVLRVLLIALAAFVASRIVLFFPASEAGGRFKRWWMDYLLVAAGVTWWAIDPSREPIVLRVGAMYLTALGLGTAWQATLNWLTERIGVGRPVFWRMVLALAALALAGTLVLALPACWSAPVTGQKAAQYAMHLLNCSFTAVAAVTCTALTPLEIGQDFTPAGHLTILVLMQVGGMTALILGTAVAVRWRQSHAVNGSFRDELSRIVRWAIGCMVVAELLGAAALYSMWDSSRDPVFEATVLPSIGQIDLARVLFSVFHAVSAFCNGGLSLCRNDLATYGWQWQVYGAILPLMVLGSIGAPALHELWTRRLRRSTESLSYPTRVTLWGTLLLLVGGAGLLFAIESTHRLQLRYPRERTPGRLQLEISSDTQDPTATQNDPRSARLAQLDPAKGAAMGLFVSAAARSTGFNLVRLDERSITPASRWLLILLMFVGGGLGATAGGVRIVTAWLPVRAVFRGSATSSGCPSSTRVLAAMLLLITGTMMVLLYRDVGSFESSLFESVSACCNVGLSTGLTRQLYVEARIALIIAMLMGPAIPLSLSVTATPER